MVSLREAASCATVSSSSAPARRNSRISGASFSPSAVRRTPWRPRSSSGKPISRSSEFIMCVSPDCV